MGVKGYEELITKLDQFIRKYYKNRMIRGAIYCVALIMAAYLFITISEYFGRFSIGMRTFLFYGFILGVLAVLVKNLFIPLFKMYRLGKTISHDQAASIIGKHFPEVRDKLLNTLQLKAMAEKDTDNSLLYAGIEQRIKHLRPVPFSSAIDFKENRRYLKYAIPPVAVFLILLFAAPSVLTKPTERLIRHDQLIAEEAPFVFIIENHELRAAQNEDFTLELSVKGNEIPAKAYIVIAGQQFLLEKKDAFHFSYTLKNLKENQSFALYASGFSFGEYEIEVLPVPALADFSVTLNYPAYTRRTNEKIRNTGDVTVPAGTRIHWEFATKNTDKLSIRFGDSTYVLKSEKDRYAFAQTLRTSTPYAISASNPYIAGKDSIRYSIQVIPDLYPSIFCEEERDSASWKDLFFTGEVKDDYGFKRLTFNYTVTRAGQSAEEQWKSVEVPVSAQQVTDNFFFSWSLEPLGIQAGDKVNYYFEIWDNDGVNGSKSTKSSVREYALPTLEELDQMVDQKNEDIKSQLEESVKEAKKLDKDLEDLQRQLLEKKEVTWQDKKKLEDILKRQEELRNQIEQIQKENKNKNNTENQFRQQEKLVEKQQQLEKLMEEIMNPELEKLMEEIQKLMEELNKEQIQQELDKMELNAEDMEKELDRALEQFKQLEFEQKFEKTVEKLEKLAEKQEQLSKESESKESKSEELKEKQEELNKEFDALKKEMDALEKMNEELENPNPMPDTEQQQNEIQQDQKESSDQLQKNKKSGAGKSQKSAADKMKQMANQMEMAMQSGEEEQQQEDMDALRALLENIITLSFDQEALMNDFKKTDIRDPGYVKLGQVQRKLKDDARMVEDSLFALSKRVPAISAAVNREINQVNESMETALKGVGEKRTPEITTAQQYAMTSFNNLALMLDEALRQMQQQASQSKPGQGNCEKPGGNGKKPKPSAGDIKKMQESLSKQLEELKKKGQNKGENKGGKGEMSKQLAEMAAKQSAIRKMMEEKAAELNQDGSGQGNELKKIAKDMEQLQKDIVNNKIDENTLRRQQDIMTRLLKAEEAERVREQDNQRKSNEAKDAPVSNPQKYEEYLRRKERETEMLRTVPPDLSPYYKDKVNNYFNKLGKE